MRNKITVYKNRTNTLRVYLGIDVSADTITSEIRTHPTVDSTLIVAWTVAFITDGTDGGLLLTIDDSLLTTIAVNSGWMDLKRVSGGQPLPVFNDPLEVVFKDAVTA